MSVDAAAGEAAGLYAHIPFCLTRCGYCDFNTYAGLGHLASRYADALAAEAELWRDEWGGARFVSVFLGGGTPTVLEPATLATLLRRLRGAFEVAADAEVTCEANPDTVDERVLTRLLAAGVTRLSIGLQSFDPAVLRALERVHPAEAATAAVRAARAAGFDDVNVDLIYGADGETLASWGRTLERTVELAPDHVSAYALTIEPATPLARRVRHGDVVAPDADLQADMYDAACEALAEAGYEHYEVSNWARPGHRCAHNVGYWRGRPCLGLGAGAHSFREGRRWWNVRPPQQYLDLVEAARRPVGGEERLSDAERSLERLLLGLRTDAGVTVDAAGADALAPLADAGLARVAGSRAVLTERGMLLANEAVLLLAGRLPTG